MQLFYLETLQRFKVAMQKTSKAKEELKDQSSYIELPEMKSKRKECQDAEKQLIEVEKKLGETFLLCLHIVLVQIMYNYKQFLCTRCTSYFWSNFGWKRELLYTRLYIILEFIFNSIIEVNFGEKEFGSSVVKFGPKFWSISKLSMYKISFVTS